jgi:hypothetical protein
VNALRPRKHGFGPGSRCVLNKIRPLTPLK